MTKQILFSSFFFFTVAYGQYCTSNVGPTSNADSNVELVQINGALGNINFVGCPAVIGVQDLTALSVTLNAGSPYILNVKFGTFGGNYGLD